MENMYDDFIDEPNESPNHFSSSRSITKPSNASYFASNSIPKEILRAYEAIDAAIKKVDAATVALSDEIRTADSVSTEDELRKFRITINEKVTEIRGKMLRSVSDAIRALKRQRDALQRAETLNDAQFIIVEGKVKSYQRALSNKESTLNEVSKKSSQLFDSISKRLRAAQLNQNDADAPGTGQEEEQLLRQELQEVEFVDEREGELIQEVHKDMTEVLALMNLMATEVYENQKVIDRIETNVKDAERDVDAGVDQLKKAEKHQKCSKKCLIIWGVIILIVAIIIISVLSTIFK